MIARSARGIYVVANLGFRNKPFLPCSLKQPVQWFYRNWSTLPYSSLYHVLEVTEGKGPNIYNKQCNS